MPISSRHVDHLQLSGAPSSVITKPETLAEQVAAKVIEHIAAEVLKQSVVDEPLEMSMLLKKPPTRLLLWELWRRFVITVWARSAKDWGDGT